MISDDDLEGLIDNLYAELKEDIIQQQAQIETLEQRLDEVLTLLHGMDIGLRLRK